MTISINAAGRIGSDIKEGKTYQGKKFKYFSFVTTTKYSRSEPISTWISVTFWEDTIGNLEKIESYLKKGSQIFLSASIVQLTTYVNKNNETIPKIVANGNFVSFLPASKPRDEDAGKETEATNNPF